MKKKIFIEGMSCGHCVKHATEALNEINGMTKVEVNLSGKFAIVEGNDSITDEVIKAAIDEVGYEVVGIEEA